MDSSKNLGLETALEILEERLLEHSGRYLSQSELVLIKGCWEGKDYKDIARDSGYNMHYLQTGVGPQLWPILTEVIGEGTQVRKLNLKNILLKLAKKDYLKKLEVSEEDSDRLVGQTRLYGDFPKITSFYGRQDEINKLKHEINVLKKRCVALIGIGGVGKSLLASKIIEEILLEKPGIYEYVIWRTLSRSSTLEEVIIDLLLVLGVEKIDDKSFHTKISLLTKQLEVHRCLVVLDGFEAIAEINTFEKRLEYEDFLVAMTGTKHQSCVIITSQIPLKEVSYATVNLSVKSILIEGLDANAALQLLKERGLKGEKCKQLIETYRGKPSELETVADRINRIFGGSVEKFFDYKTTVVGPRIEAMLNRQFGQGGLLSDFQKQILVYLAEEVSKTFVYIPFSKLADDLKERLNSQLSISQLITDLEILEERSLIETSKKSNKQELSFSVEPVIRKYILIDPNNLIHKSNKTEVNTSMQEQNSL